LFALLNLNTETEQLKPPQKQKLFRRRAVSLRSYIETKRRKHTVQQNFFCSQLNIEQERRKSHTVKAFSCGGVAFAHRIIERKRHKVTPKTKKAATHYA